MNIGELIRGFGTKADVTFARGEVVSVSLQDWTCEVAPLDGTPSVPNCLLQSVEGADGAVLVPKVGSTVFILIQGHTGRVIQVEELELVFAKIGQIEVDLDKNGLSVKGLLSDLTKDIGALLDLQGKIIDELMQFKLLTVMGPTIAVSPDIIAKLAVEKVNLELLRTNFKSYLKDA